MPRRREHGGQPLPESSEGELEVNQPESKQEGSMGDHGEDRTLQILEDLVKGNNR
jgi:hypothetical protein